MSDTAYDQPKRALDGGFATTFVLGTGAVTQTLIAAKTGPLYDPHVHTIHVQRLTVLVRTGSSSKTWTIEDESGVDVSPGALDMSTAGASYSYDFGPRGHALTAGEDLKVTISGAGAAGDITVEGYQERGDALAESFTLSAATVDVHATLALTLTAGPGTVFFAGTATVVIGGVSCTAVTVVNGTSITCTVPAVGHGEDQNNADVVLTQSDGSVITFAAAFDFTEQSYTISLVAPDNGAAAGGTSVTLTGYYFGAGVGVTFGGVPATSVVPAVGGLTCTCVTPAHGAGAVDVVFLNTDTTTATAAGGYTYA